MRALVVDALPDHSPPCSIQALGTTAPPTTLFGLGWRRAAQPSPGGPPGLARSRGWGRPGGTLGGPAVGDSGPLLGPDRRAPKQANSPQTGLYVVGTAKRALRHSFPSGTCDTDSMLRQLRRAWFRPAESLQGSLRSPIGIDAAGKSTKHDDAANLVTQACSGHPLGSSECRV